jgi:hypothetical protein
MDCRGWLWIFIALPACLDALIVDRGRPEQRLDLLEKRKKEVKKWNWKEASEESKTEWAIVLKRYTLVDLTLFELARHFGEALSAGQQQDAADEALGKARGKLTKLQSYLEKAVLDQNTSDATAGDMQIDRKTNLLTAHEKRILADEHKREQYGFFAVEASGQDVLQQASALLQQLDRKQPKPAQPSWSSIVAAPPAPKVTYMSIFSSPNVSSNSSHLTSGNATAHQSTASNATMLFQRFEEASQTFHRDLGNFESMQTKAITNLLAIAEQ